MSLPASKPARIVIDAREFTTSTGRYMFKLIEYLQQLDTQNEYQILLAPKDYAIWQPAAANFHTVRCPFKEFTFAEQVGLLRQLNGLQADLVHFGMTQQPVLYRRPHVTTVHDLTTIRFNNPSKNPLVYWCKQTVYKQVIKSVARSSARLITPSQFVSRDLQTYSGVSADKIQVTYESSDQISEPPTAPPDLPCLTKEDFIMYIGRPQPHKNLDRLIEAFALLQATHPALQLVLAGKQDATYQAIARRAAERGIKHVVFTGFVSDAQLRWLYEHCRAYIFPSLSEGFGLPGLEAMRHGAPVVSSNATCLPEVYGDAAHYFDPLDVPAMAAAIGQVLDDPALRAALINKGDIRVHNFSWRRMAQQTLTVYRSVLSK